MSGGENMTDITRGTMTTNRGDKMSGISTELDLRTLTADEIISAMLTVDGLRVPASALRTGDRIHLPPRRRDTRGLRGKCDGKLLSSRSRRSDHCHGQWRCVELLAQGYRATAGPGMTRLLATLRRWLLVCPTCSEDPCGCLTPWGDR